MEQVAAFMLLVGCTSDASVCKEIPVPVAFYESVSQCQDNLQLQIRLSESTADKVLGACKGVGAQEMQQSATIDWAVSRDDKLIVSLKPEAQVVASR